MVKRFLIACAALLFASYAQAQITEPFGTFVGGLSNAVAVSNSDALYVLQGGVSKRASPGVISGAAGTPTGSIMWNNSGLLAGFGNWNGTSTVAIGNGGVAQSLRVYNTVDSLATPANFESAIFDWQTTTNVLTIGTINSGTGVGRNFQFIAGGNIVGDFGVTAPGLWTLPMVVTALQFGPTGNQAGNHPPQLYFGAYTASGSIFPNIVINSTTFTQQGAIGPASTSTPTDALWIGAVNGRGQTWNLTQKLDLELPLGTFRAYNTTDATATNFERGAFGFQSNVLTIGTQQGGTGQARNVSLITGGTEAMRIDSTQQVTLSGASQDLNATRWGSHVTPLEIVSAVQSNFGVITYTTNTNLTSGLFLGTVNSSTIGTFGASVSGETLGQITFFGSDTSRFIDAARIEVVADSNFGTNAGFGRLAFLTNPGGNGSAALERLRIDNAGRIMIGGTASQVLGGNNIEFQIHGTSFASSTSGNVRWQNNTSSPSIYMAKSRGASIGTHAAVTNNDDLGFIVFLGDDGTNFPEAAYISSDVDGSVAAGSVPTRVAIWTTPVGGTSPAEAMRIDSKRHVNYTTSAPTASACAGFALSTGSSDTAGRVTFTSATSCAISFATAFTNAPFCSVIPGSAASTVTITTSTTVLTATFGTAQTAMFYQCFGN